MKGPAARWLELGEVPPDLERPAVWLARNDDPRWEALVAGLRPGPADLADAALFAAPARSAARLARRLLLKALVGAALGVRGDEIAVERAPAGSIRIVAPQPLCASLSARDGWTCVGLCRRPVGVDIDTMDTPLPLPLDVLAEEEAEAVTGLAADLQPAAFARYWTVKEAVLKAAGTGLNADPARLTVRFVADAAEVLDAAGRRIGFAEVRTAGPGAAAVAMLSAGS